MALLAGINAISGALKLANSLVHARTTRKSGVADDQFSRLLRESVMKTGTGTDPESLAKSVMESRDANNDGVLTFTEWGGSARAFEIMDANSSHTADMNELTAHYQRQ